MHVLYAVLLVKTRVTDLDIILLWCACAQMEVEAPTGRAGPAAPEVHAALTMQGLASGSKWWQRRRQVFCWDPEQGDAIKVGGHSLSMFVCVCVCKSGCWHPGILALSTSQV